MLLRSNQTSFQSESVWSHGNVISNRKLIKGVNTAMKDHCRTNNHHITMDSISILARESNSFYLRIKESLLIASSLLSVHVLCMTFLSYQICVDIFWNLNLLKSYQLNNSSVILPKCSDKLRELFWFVLFPMYILLFDFF